MSSTTSTPVIFCLIVRDMGVFPEVLLVEHPLTGLSLPSGDCVAGEDPRSTAFGIARSSVGIGNFSSIKDLTAEDEEVLRHVFVLRRNEPVGSLGYWSRKVDGVVHKIRWVRLDQHIPLAKIDQSILATHMPFLLD